MGELMVECLRDECGWYGPIDEAVHPKHDPDTTCCPECHERAYPCTADQTTERHNGGPNE